MITLEMGKLISQAEREIDLSAKTLNLTQHTYNFIQNE